MGAALTAARPKKASVWNEARMLIDVFDSDSEYMCLVEVKLNVRQATIGLESECG